MATAGGLTYDLPQDNIARQMSTAPVRSGANTSQSGQNLDPLSKLMEDELYQQEGRTQEYYTKVGALQTFAKQAASAGIDVTRPDYTNPQSIKYHNIYQQAIADIYNTRNDLTRLKSFEDESMKDPNLVRSFDDSGSPVFAQTGQTAFVKQFQEQAAQVKSEDELAQFNQNKKAAIQELQARMASAVDPRERAQFRSQIDQLSQVNPGIGISPYQQASLEQDDSQFRQRLQFDQEKARRELALKSQEAGTGKEAVASNRLLNIFGSFESRDTSQLVASTGVSEPSFSDSLGGTFFNYVDPSGYMRSIKIDLSSNQAFRNSAAAFNSVMNAGPGSEGGGDVSNENILSIIDSLDEEKLTKYRQSLIKEWYGPNATEETVDMADGFKKALKEGVKKGGENEVFERVAKVLNFAQDGYVPRSALDKKKLKGNYYINSIETDFSNFFGLTSDDIRINVYNDDGKEETIVLNLGDDKDLNILNEIIEENVDLLPRDIMSKLQGS
jgi:hypothetical protein